MPAGATLVYREAVMERQFNLSVNLFIHSFSLHARRCGGRAGGLHPSKYTTDRPRPSDCVKDCTHPPSAGVGCLSANLVEATRISAVAGIPDVHSRYALLNACPSRLSRRCACPVGFGSDRMSTLTEASHATPEPKKKPWHAYRLAYMQTHRRGKLTIERWAQRGTHSRLHSYHTHKETNTHTHTHTHTTHIRQRRTQDTTYLWRTTRPSGQTKETFDPDSCAHALSRRSDIPALGKA